MTDRENCLIVFDHQNLEYTRGLIFESLNEWLYYQETWRDENFRHILRFSDDDEVSAALAFVWELRDCTLLCEEVDTLCSPSWIDESLKKIVKYGAHRNIALVAVSRRLPEVSRLLSSQANCVITFKQAEGIDLSALKQRGFDLDAIAHLEPHASLTKTY
jgi:hypothetical protein